MPDRYDILLVEGLRSFQTAFGKSMSLSGMVSQNDGIPFSHLSGNQSISNSMLCKAQQVNHISSQFSITHNLIPVFKTCHLPFIMLNVHSTSFLKLSSHLENLIPDQRLVSFIGGTVILQLRYPLSTITYGLLYYISITFPSASKSK